MNIIKMEEIYQVGFKQHPAIMSCFTAHLDRYWVSKTSFATLETAVRKVKTNMMALQTYASRLNGARVKANPCGTPTCATPADIPGR
jgi:hypothetical protein